MYFYALTALGLALGLVVLFCLLDMAQRMDAPLERRESCPREKRIRGARLIPLGE
jgi:hypothetical protein